MAALAKKGISYPGVGDLGTRLATSTDVLIYVLAISNTHAVTPNKLAFTSLHCSISSYTLKVLRSDKPSHRHDSNQYQTKAFICQIRPVLRQT